MDGVVFMKYVRVNKSGVHVFVTHSAKSYEETKAGIYNPITDKMHYTESVNRADSDVQYTGSWVEVKDSEFLTNNDAVAPMWLQTGFPIMNKVFRNNVIRIEKDKYGNETKIYQVSSANLTNKENADLVARFKKAYPKYYGKIVKNYEAKVARGEFKSLAQRISEFKNRKPGSKEESLFSVFTGGKTTLPFDKNSLKTARRGKVQEWCELVDINYKDFSSMQEAKAALFQML